MLRHRVPYGIMMIAVALAVVTLDGRWAPIFPLLFIASTYLTWTIGTELVILIDRLPLRIRHRRYARWAALAIVWANWLPALVSKIVPALGLTVAMELDAPTMKASLTAFMVVGMWGYILTSIDYQRPGDSVLSIAGYLFVFFYVGLMSSFLYQLRWLDANPEFGAAAILVAVLTPKFGDMGAYFFGRWLGKHKIAPKLSPAKTFEGAFGGLVFSVTTACWLGSHPIPYVSSAPLMHPWGAAMFGLLVGAVGQVGDLMESLIKRDCEAKDAAHSIPGFGGLLDVADAVLFSAPVSYLLLVSFRTWFRAALPM
jgi:phosphatidate cytidylyltransferase